MLQLQLILINNLFSGLEEVSLFLWWLISLYIDVTVKKKQRNVHNNHKKYVNFEVLIPLSVNILPMQEKQANTNTLVQILNKLHLRNSTFSMQSSVVVFITPNKSSLTLSS